MSILRTRMHAASNPVILLEVTSEKQVSLAKKIKGLGGKYIASKKFEKNATHLVCDKVTCSEKFLGACVRGLWVVSSKFIEDSFEEGHWLKEDSYELYVYDSRQDKDLVLAARRWRWKVSLFQEQPFNGWQVALAFEFSKYCVYSRLLAYGGASIIPLPSQLQSENVQHITYVFLDHSNVHLANQLLEYGLLGLTEKFIIDTIIKDDVLDPFDYIISSNSIGNCFESQLLYYDENTPDHLPDTYGARIFNISDLPGDVIRSQSQSHCVTSLSQRKTVSIKNVPMETVDGIHQIVEGILPLEEGYGESERKTVTGETRIDDCDSEVTEMPKLPKQLHADMSHKNKVLDSEHWMKLYRGDNIKQASSPGDSLQQSQKYVGSYPHGQAKTRDTFKKSNRSIASDTYSVVDDSEDEKEADFPSEGLPESTNLNKSLKVNYYLYGPWQQSDCSPHPRSDIGQTQRIIKQNKQDREHLPHRNKLVELNSSSHSQLTETGVKRKKLDNIQESINTLPLTTSVLPPKCSVHSVAEPSDSNPEKKIQLSHSSSPDAKRWSPTRLTLSPNIYIHGPSYVHSHSSDKSISQNISEALRTKHKHSKKQRDVDYMRDLETSSKNNPARPSPGLNKEKSIKSESQWSGKPLEKLKPKLKALDPTVLLESLDSQQSLNGIKARKTSIETSVFDSCNRVTALSETELLCNSGTSHFSLSTDSSVCPNITMPHPVIVMSNSDPVDFKPTLSEEVKTDTLIESKALLTLPPNPYIHGLPNAVSSTVESKPKVKPSIHVKSEYKHLSKSSTRRHKKLTNEHQKFSKTKHTKVKGRRGKVLSQMNMSSAHPMESTPKRTQLSLQDCGFSSSYKKGLKRETSVEDSPKPVHWTSKVPTRRNLTRILTQKSSTTHINPILTPLLASSPKTSIEHFVENPTSPSMETADRQVIVLTDTNDLVMELHNDNNPSVVTSELPNSLVSASCDQDEMSQKRIKSPCHSKNIFTLMSDMFDISEQSMKHDNVKPNSSSNDFPVAEGGGTSLTGRVTDTYIDWNSKIKSGSLSSELKEIYNTYCVRKSERVKERESKNRPETCATLEDDDTELEEPLTFHKSSGWTFSYSVGVDPGLYKTCPEVNELYGEWMQSARGFELYNMSCNHGSPRADRRPTSLLIKELFLLLQCPEALVRDKANYYLRDWLALHPPVTPETTKLYTEALGLTPHNTFLIDAIKSCIERPEHFMPAWLVEFCVLMFEINFDHCLKQGSKKVLQSSMITKWLWVSPHSVFHSGSTIQLLRLLEFIISSPEPNVPLCVALCSLISMAAECVRLASVHWNPENLSFVSDSALAISHDLAKKIQHCLSLRGYDAAALVISSVKPPWLKTLVLAVILSSYNNYLISERIHVNNISLSSIVSQYFFLVPPLQECSGTSLMNASSSNHSDRSSVSSLSDSILPPIKSVQNNLNQKKTLKVNKRNGRGESAVHMACKRNNVEKLQQLLAVPGVDVNLRDYIGWTPLHEACHSGSYDCVLLLLKYVPNTSINDALEQGTHAACKVDLNAVGPDGVTPLIDAVGGNHVEICRQLLKYGGQQLLNAKNSEGYTALDLAYTSEMRDVLNDINLSESILELVQESSQEPSSQYVSTDIQTIHETAPLSSLYEEAIGAKYVLEKDCADFLSLLTSLVSSYYMSMPSHPSNQRLIGLHERDTSVLHNMRGHVKLLKRHIKKLTKPEDYKSLLFHVELLELVCLSKM